MPVDLYEKGLTSLLQRFGVSFLTGEGDNTTLGRIICDVTEEGARRWSRFLGGHITFAEGGNWNPSVGTEKATSSILASQDLLWSFVFFCLVEGGAVVYKGTRKEGVKGRAHGHCFLFCSHGDAKAFWQGHEGSPAPEYLQEDYDWQRYASLSHAEGEGTRCRHAFTGRII